MYIGNRKCTVCTNKTVRFSKVNATFITCINVISMGDKMLKQSIE